MSSYEEVTAGEIDEFLAKIDEIKNTSQPNIDGQMLWCAANLTFFAGVNKNEIPWFKVKDVFTEGDIVSEISMCGNRLINPIRLPDRVKEILRECISYLQGNSPELDPDSALFPDYSVRGGDKALTKDLKVFSLQFKELQRIGASNYYWAFVRDGSDPDEAKRETAKQFREGDEDRGPIPTYTLSPQREIRANRRKAQSEQKREQKRDEKMQKEGPDLRISTQRQKERARKKEQR